MAQRGGGLYGNAEIVGNPEAFGDDVCTIFEANSAQQKGGGAFFVRGENTINNALFMGNQTMNDHPGGAVAAITVEELKIDRCTFSGNRASSALVIELPSINDVKIENSIFWNEECSQEISAPWPIDSTEWIIRYCDIRGLNPETDSMGRFGKDPVFENPGNWTNEIWAPTGYFLGRGSPCIDAGDLDVWVEPEYVRLDIGAYAGTLEERSGL
jgi:hypothetical protein